MKNKAAQSLAKLRWARIPKEERAQHVPQNHGAGGRPRIYPQCPRYKAHRFVIRHVCGCCGKIATPSVVKAACSNTADSQHVWCEYDRCPCGYERNLE